MFNIIEFLKTAAIAFPALLPIVMALVTFFSKLFDLKGKAQLVCSLLCGLVLGIAVMFFTTNPSTAVAWFSAVLFALLVGLAASGCYDVLKESRS